MTHANTARQRTRRPRRTLGRTLTRLFATGALTAGFTILGSANGALVPSGATEAETMALTQAPVIWAIDSDGDGVADYYNPTHGAVRAYDAFGSGQFGAIRDAGKRRHEGVDYVAAPGAEVHAPISGQIARLAYAYGGQGGYRVVEIVNPETKINARVFYVAPTVEVGDVVVAGQVIGTAQDLNTRYPGITNHVHVELRDPQRRVIDASEELPAPT